MDLMRGRDFPTRSRHNGAVHGQAPAPHPTPATNPSDVVDALQHLGWVDITALSVLVVFFVLGLFKGLVWQVSRVLILGAAYALAARLGQQLSELLLRWTHAGPTPPTEEQQLTAFYIACVLIFVGVLVVLSLLSLLLQNLVKRAGLGFYDRLFGGVLGVGSGAIVVLFLLTAVYMFFPNTRVAEAATTSHSLQFSKDAVELMGAVIPEPLRRVFPTTSNPSTQPTTPADPAAPGATAAEADARATGQPTDAGAQGHR